MRHVLRMLLVLLVGCHQQCGDNGGEVYAHFLDGSASCVDLRRGESQTGDWALCTAGSEEWLCQLGECRVVGPPVIVKRVR